MLYQCSDLRASLKVSCSLCVAHAPAFTVTYKQPVSSRGSLFWPLAPTILPNLTGQDTVTAPSLPLPGSTHRTFMKVVNVVPESWGPLPRPPGLPQHGPPLPLFSSNISATPYLTKTLTNLCLSLPRFLFVFFSPSIYLYPCSSSLLIHPGPVEVHLLPLSKHSPIAEQRSQSRGQWLPLNTQSTSAIPLLSCVGSGSQVILGHITYCQLQDFFFFFGNSSWPLSLSSSSRRPPKYYNSSHTPLQTHPSLAIF